MKQPVPPRASPLPAMKQVALVTRTKDWTWDCKGRTVYEFFAQIDTYANVCNRSEEKALIAKAKLQGIALQFVHGREILAHDACLTESFSENCPRRNIPDYWMLRQRNGKALRSWQIDARASQRIIRKVNDEATQRVINEVTERRTELPLPGTRDVPSAPLSPL